jgi:hypothetical protein
MRSVKLLGEGYNTRDSREGNDARFSFSEITKMGEPIKEFVKREFVEQIKSGRRTHNEICDSSVKIGDTIEFISANEIAPQLVEGVPQTNSISVRVTVSKIETKTDLRHTLVYWDGLS